MSKSDNPWANGHSIEVLRAVSAALTPNVGDFATQAVDMDGVNGEIVRVGTPSESHSILYLHGGAYLCGSPQQYRNITVSLARLAQVEVIAVDYRLAPEHGHPAAFEDALVAYRWLDRNRPNAQLVIAGDSAGAAIAVATALDAPSHGCRTPAAIMCNSPFADLSLSSASLDDPHRNQQEPNRKTIEWLVQSVVDASRTPLNPRDERISPVYRDLTGLPPMLVQTGGMDNLEDDGIRLAQRAQDCGVDVVLTRYPDCLHIWPVLAPADQDSESQAALEEMVHFIERWTA